MQHTTSAADLATNLQSALDDALARLAAVNPPGWPTRLADCDILLWQQTWPDTGCGFGRIAGQAITAAHTLVVWDNNSAAAIVYHDWRFARLLDRPNRAFRDACRERNLPGAASPHWPRYDDACEAGRGA